MPKIIHVETLLSEYEYDQKEVFDVLKEIWKEKYFNLDRIEKVFENTSVKKRYFPVELSRYKTLDTFEDKNTAWQEAARRLAPKLVTKLIENSGVDTDTIDLFCSNSITGLSVPSIESIIINEIGLKRSTVRLPIFGLGCLAGVAGLNRVCDFLKGSPKSAALFLSIEFCSLTMQKEDLSMANIISSGLFGDGLACVLVVGDEHPLATRLGLDYQGSKSEVFADTERVMGWDFVNSGMKVVLSSDVPKISKDMVPPVVNEFLKDQNLSKDQIRHYIAHPGGPKVLGALVEGLGLSQDALNLSYDTLKEYGNLSSVSVLFVLKKFFDSSVKNDGEDCLALAMGPAFCVELSHFIWRKS